MFVRIINGTFGYREKGEDGRYSISVQPKTRLDPPFEVDDQIGNDLVRNGIAEPAVRQSDGLIEQADSNAPDPDALVNGQGPDDEKAAADADEESQNEGALGPAQLKSMSMEQLRELAKQMGISTGKLRSREKLIDAITSEKVIPGPELSSDETEPNLSPAEPVV